MYFTKIVAAIIFFRRKLYGKETCFFTPQVKNRCCICSFGCSFFFAGVHQVAANDLAGDNLTTTEVVTSAEATIIESTPQESPQIEVLETNRDTGLTDSLNSSLPSSSDTNVDDSSTIYSESTNKLVTPGQDSSAAKTEDHATLSESISVSESLQVVAASAEAATVTGGNTEKPQNIDSNTIISVPET